MAQSPEKMSYQAIVRDASSVLQNEKGLDRYIDKILTEKAEKKANK